MMGNKYLWAIGGLFLGLYIAKRRAAKSIKDKIDNAIDTVENEAHANFNQAIDSAIQQGLDLQSFKQIINTPDQEPQNA